MLEYLNKLDNDYREMLNVKLLNKDYDKDLVDYIYLAIKGFEILPQIKILGYTWEPEENKYDPHDHIMRRNKYKKKIIKNMSDTRCGVMYIDIQISGIDKNGAKKVHFIKKPIIVPLLDKNGYYTINGRKSFLIYQMVDKLLYPSLGAVTVKSLMPICVKTIKEELTDTDNNTHIIPTYHIQIFKSAINVMMIYSHLAITKTLNFMEVDRFISIHDKNNYMKENNRIYFECNKKSNICVSVDKDAFDKFVYVKSIVGCLIKLFEENKVEYDKIDDRSEWMKIVGGKGTEKRGEYQHIFFNRLLDDVTRAELKIHEYDKQNIYYLLRWIIQNYHYLWSKDNLSMENKRLRCNEYLGSLMTAEVSKRITALVSLGDKATDKDYLSRFKFPEDIFISRLYSSGILRYTALNNDMDISNKAKFTKKGDVTLVMNIFSYLCS